MSPSDQPSALPSPDASVVSSGWPAADSQPSAWSGPSSGPGVDGLLAERCAWSLVWLGVLAGGLSTWGMWSTSSALTVVAPLLVLVATIGIICSWLSRYPRSRNFQILTLTMVAVTVVASQYGAIHSRRYYSSDSAAFGQVAAQILLHGRNPYAVSLSSAGHLLSTPARYWTDTVTGGHITNVSYPAGSFLLIAPAMLLGFHHQIVDWVDLLAWLVAGVLLFALVPVALRWMAALLLLTPVFLGIFSSGGTDAIFLPFLMLAVWRWDRYGGGRALGVASWIGPVALGCACAIKQGPWFCLPFLMVGVALEAQRAGRSPLGVAARYGGTVVAVFALINLPFIVWNPSAWLHGTVTPFVEPLVADGQGLVSLATHGISRGVDLTDLTVCGGLVYLTVLMVFATTYPWLKRVWLVAVPLALFFSPRSLSSYLVDFLPVALLAAVSVAAVERAPRPVVEKRRGWRQRLPLALCAVPALGAVAAGVLAFSSAPLGLTVRRVDTGGGGTTMTALTLSLRNLTGSPQVPHVMVTMGSSYSAGFWLPRHGGMKAIPAHGQTTVTLYPPYPTFTALVGSQWLVAAYTADPKALSTSTVQVGQRLPNPPG